MGAYWKDLFREIKNTPGRFISLIVIAILGAASIVGIQATSIDMRDVADKTYKERNLYDIQIKSTTGFDEDDIAALTGTPGVAAVMATDIADAFINVENENRTVRTYALPDCINLIDLLDGRLPENPAECVVEQNMLDDRGIKTGGSGIKIGGIIRLGLDNMDDYYEIFADDTFTVVGVVSSPLYITFQRGNTTLGNGSLNYYLYLHPDAYKLDVFTDIYILMDGSQSIENLSSEYYDAADGWKRQIEQTGNLRVRAKKDELADAQREIDDGWAEYYKGIEMYESGLLTLGALDTDALTQLADAKKKLEEAQEKLDKAPEPEWFIFTRKDGVAFDSYYQDTLRLEKIGYVFPLVFFLVAVMVSLTTMSRMVEDHRTQIGVYKALGYRPAAIMMKYLVYAFTASLVGGMAGAVLGNLLLPRVITDAYAHLYEMPPIDTPIPAPLASVAVLSAVFAVVLVTLWTYVSSMRGNPALLMRPKPPAKGKRVFLERVTFIWNRLGFFSKVTARNTFRYKKRFFMTLAGVAGCSALLLTAFGLRDSISSVADLQFHTIVRFDARAYLKDITTGEAREALDAILPSTHLYIREETMTANGPEGGLPAAMIVPEDTNRLTDHFNLYSTETNSPVGMTDRSVLITEKLSRVMGVGTGGSFSITLSDGRTYSAVVTGVVDNYLLHYVYMSPIVYSELFNVEFYSNSVLIFYEDGRDSASNLLENSNVRALIHNDEIKSQVGEQSDAMGIVTIVLIVLACALAFVVLFNLTNINISERIRELATMKVLGLNDAELAMYIYRENGVVTLLGIIIGLVGGIYLHSFVLTSVEIDVLKFPKIISAPSYIYAVAISVAFAVFVNLIMSIKLSKIDMVESLKNVE